MLKPCEGVVRAANLCRVAVDVLVSYSELRPYPQQKVFCGRKFTVLYQNI